MLGCSFAVESRFCHLGLAENTPQGAGEAVWCGSDLTSGAHPMEESSEEGGRKHETRQVWHMGPPTIFAKWKVLLNQHNHISESKSLIAKCFHGKNCMSETDEAEGGN